MRAIRALGLGFVGSILVTAPALAQRSDDSFRWYIGAQGGVLGFETPSQTRGFVPSAGGHILVTAKRTGLIIAVDEGFGSSESTGYTDVTTPNGVRDVSFNHLRRYSAILTGYPIRGNTQPYLGLGFGLLQVIDPQPGGFFTSPVQANLAQRLASDKSTHGFISFVAGLQVKLSGLQVFGQYQLTSAPGAGQLLSGAGHGLSGGIRFPLGGAKEGIHGGGY